MSLTDLIIKTGIHDAIARKLNEKGKLSKKRHRRGDHQTRAQDHRPGSTHDPRFYAQMSSCLTI